MCVFKHPQLMEQSLQLGTEQLANNFPQEKGRQHILQFSEKQPTSVYLCVNGRQREKEMRLSVFVMSANACTPRERVLAVSGQGPSLRDLSQHAPLLTQPLIASLNKPSAISPAAQP